MSEYFFLLIKLKMSLATIKVARRGRSRHKPQSYQVTGCLKGGWGVRREFAYDNIHPPYLLILQILEWE